MSTVFTDTRGESSAEFTTIDLNRLEEIERRQGRVAAFLGEHDLDALLLRRPENIAWFTCGADVTRFSVSGETTAALLITSDARVVATNDVDSPQLFEHELAGMGFQLKERPWTEGGQQLVDDLTRGRRVGADVDNGKAKFLGGQIAPLRLPLGDYEVARLRRLGEIVAHAVEATARRMEAGRTELEIAAELAHRSVKYGAVPIRLVVQGDGRGDRYRHWTPRQFPVDEYCHIGLTARRWGLHVSASRTVCLERPDEEFVRAHHIAMLAQATGIHFSREGERMVDVWSRVERIYDKFGHPDAWRLSDQAELVGYAPSERVFLPDGEHVLQIGDPLHWHPTIGGTSTGDTMIVTEKGPEVITPMEEWPRLTIEVKGDRSYRPAILRRDRDEE